MSTYDLGMAIDGDAAAVVDEIRLANRLDYDYVEWNVGNPAFDPAYWWENSDRIADELSSCGVDLVTHLPQADILIGSPYERLKDASVAVLKEYIDISVEAGASRVSLHPLFSDNDLPRRRRSANANLVDAVTEVREFAQSRDVEIVLENGIPEQRRKNQVPLQKFEQLFGDVDVPYALNVGHAHITGMTSDEIATYFDNHVDRISQLYLNDTRGHCDKHLLLGEGNIDFETILRPARTSSWSGAITVEVHTNDREYLSRSKRLVGDALD